MNVNRRNIAFGLFCCMLMLVYNSKAQQKHFLHFNVNNGLPSNHVYQVVIDTYGYAWIATTKGVLKYNGYKFRRFGEKDGLPREDVWMLVEDDLNRIWLNSKAYELGYIKNDKYTSVIRSVGGTGIYPKQMTRIKDGVCFLNSRVSFAQVYDTMDFYKVQGDKVSSQQILTEWTMLKERAIDASGNYSLLMSGSLYKLLTGADGKKSFNKICTYPSAANLSDKYISNNNQRSIILLGTTSNKLYAYTLSGCNAFSLVLDSIQGEHILGSHQVGDLYHLSTNKRRIVLDSNFKIVNTYWLKDLMPASDTLNSSLVWYVGDKLWKGFSTTSNVGLYQDLGANIFRFNEKINFSDAQYVGCSSAGIQYWWQNPERKLLLIKPDGTVVAKEYKELKAVNGVKEMAKGKMLICSSIGYFVFFEEDATLLPYMKDIVAEYAWGINMADVVKKNFIKTPGATELVGHNKLYGTKGDTIYTRAIARLCWVYYKDNIRYEKLLTPVSQISDIDMQNMCSYSYYEGKLEMYNISNNKSASLDTVALKQLGINKPKDIVADKVGRNIILLSNNGLHIYNWYNRVFRNIPLSVNASACNVAVHNNKLALLSEFGLVFCRLDSNGNVSKPVYVPNSKYSQYRYLASTTFYLDDTVARFNTDKGMCEVSVPKESAFVGKSEYTDYRLLANVSGLLLQLKNNDTIRVSGAEEQILLDVINPSGVGEVSFRYRPEGDENNWTVLNANEWYTAGLLPGRYNRVYLQAYDEAWYSDVFAIYLYTEPRWWQTPAGKAVLGGAVLLGLGLLVVVAVLFTKRVTDRANARKNMQAELKNLRTEIELKSIHAQINPHFIFNTLSTGLYFIKKKQFEDAYDHISSFSELLRNYIKSSRDKYISLNEEVDNLKKYVLLQQARFENLFDFIVEIADDINPYTEKIPALLLQPLVENAINHGLFHTGSTGGRLVLKFSKPEPDVLICVIDDNGVGRERSKDIKSDTKHKTQSYGTDLIKELIETFNRYEPIDITIEYIDKQLPETGTTVVLTIKSLSQNAVIDN